jgi:hypothetical protein
VVLLGRTLEEYAQFFSLDVEALRGKKILDVAGGVSSFTAEARAKGIEVTAFDRIYGADAEEIQKRCEHDLGEVAAAIGSKAVYCWDFYKTPEGMRAFRERAYKTFVADYRNRPGWYVAGELPRLPFADREFDLTLVSYLLLVYEEQLSYEFHLDTLRELMRVTRGEIRIYPIVTFEAEPSKYLERLREEPDFEGWNFEVIATGFEFLRGSAFYLRVKNPRAQARQAGASGAILPAR